MEASVIILTYNSSKYVNELLEGLTSRYKEALQEKRLEIIIADNASQDDTLSKVRKFDQVRIVENGDNVGFAKGNNLAVEKAKGEFVIFLNPDAKIVSGDIFSLTKMFEDPKVGVVGGKILNAHNGRELSCGKTYNWFNVLLLSIGLEEKLGVRFAPNKERKVDYVSGAFFVIRKTLFETLHGFDDHYFMYIEDSDLCYRVRKKGYSVLFSPEATIQHIGQGSSNRTFAVVNIYKGLFYFNQKHMGVLSYTIVKLMLKTKAFLLVILGKISHNEYLTQTYEKAFKVN